MGAVDVVPVIPIRGATAQECVALSREIGAEVAERHGIPVYLYEDSATAERRRNLAEVRKGEFEGFAAKMKAPEWKPDFGPDSNNRYATLLFTTNNTPSIESNWVSV